ncbi:glycosyltransferase family 2 protein [Vibrio sp. qd031]|uniref:glycosyltransferase family 2 protein n=1 Tax=Vibrio sp. qd031 TaxID=1603038 RepID=UPI0011817486|nr:glycosyltransferase family 2 protein [Vibrio sp. qd031]
MIKTLKAIFWSLPFSNALYSKVVARMPEQVTLGLIKRKQLQELASFAATSDKKVLLILDLSRGGYDIDVLISTVRSVRSQSFSDWQLLVTGEVEEAKCRIKSVFQDDRVLFEQLEVGSYTFVAELYPGQQLNSMALSALLHFSSDDTNVLYSDSMETISGKGKAILRSGWNLELAYSQYYLGAFVLYRASVFGDLHTWLVKPSHFQRVLHIIANTYSEVNAIHVPYMLYSDSSETPNYSADSDAIALERYLNSTYNIDRKANVKVVNGMVPRSNRVVWPTPAIPPLVSVIIPTKNGKNLVEQCIDSILRCKKSIPLEIILVDNQSDEYESLHYFDCLERDETVRLLRYNRQFNYSAINNFAVEHARGDLIVFMNNDIELIDNLWLDEFVRQLSRDTVGCVGAKLYYPNDTIQHAGVILGLGRCAGHSHKHFARDDDGYLNRLKLVQNYQAVTAALLGVRKDVFEQVGGFNEVDLKVAFNDVDFCLKVQQAGYSNVWSPYIEAYHHESISRGDDFSPHHRQRFFSEVAYMQTTWKLDSITDHHYNPWLTLGKEDFSVDHTSLYDK